MAMKRNGISRRGFLGAGAGLALGGLVRPQTAHASTDGSSRSRVVLVRSEQVVSRDGSVGGKELHRMLDAAMGRLEPPGSAEETWRSLFQAADVVGIKTNVWGSLRTPEALEDAIRLGIERVGVARENIAVDDRGVRSNPVFQRCTAIVNVRPMRTHHWSGLGTCLKNMIMFVPQPSAYHGDTCATLGAIWKLPELAGKVRLNILVMLTPQFHGVGPHSFSKDYVWPYGGLIVGTDPVAVDATGMRIIEAKRAEHFGERRPVSPSPHHIQVASERYGLGEWKPERIELVRVGWETGALI